MTKLTKVMSMKKITQSLLAKKLGISQSAVSKNAKRGIKTISTAKKYATVLKCSPLSVLEYN